MIEEILCKRCGKELIELHCKRFCMTCGASEDCTDLTIDEYDEGGESE